MVVMSPTEASGAGEGPLWLSGWSGGRGSPGECMGREVHPFCRCCRGDRGEHPQRRV